MSRFTKTWVGFVVWFLTSVGIAYLFWREQPTETAAIPCRAESGAVWVFSIREGRYEPTTHPIGPDVQAHLSFDGKLDCDPEGLQPAELQALSNGIVERLSLSRVGDRWQFEVFDELRGLFVTVYAYERERSAPSIVSATHRPFGLRSIGFVIGLSMLCFGLLSLLWRERDHRVHAGR